ncbi:MerR family transcriptional regulator [Kineococcus esterisolvens]|uniref:MerR family transcriptional regulator n=1 Tax=unclassified Kineococcus TaxID=2621656 RepID=UPI003D7CE141
MRIGELAAKVGVSVRALRYYEEQGLLVSTRSHGGQRTYVESDVERVRLLQSLYTAGMPSRAIVDVLTCVDHPSHDHEDQAWTRMQAQRDHLTVQIDELLRTRDALDRLLGERPSTRATAAGADRH